MSLSFTTILRYGDTEPTEVGLGCLSVLFGLWIVVLRATSPDAVPSLYLFAGVAPEWVWGGWFSLLGLARLWAIKYGTVTHRRAAAFVTALMWWALWLGLVQANVWSTATVVHGVTGLAGVWVWVRLSWVKKAGRHAAD